ncbi:MAG: tetratricopeptide repeat protein [Planctomycetaceae bacterium]|nr:tetratricopeptide repeat protein [Planctomycetaceae bacterium]
MDDRRRVGSFKFARLSAGGMLVIKFVTAALLIVTSLVGRSPAQTRAERSPPPAAADEVGPNSKPGPSSKSEPGIAFQELEDPVQRFKPAKPRGVGDEVRLDALGWYAAARVMQSRNDLPGALRAYRRAIESDPTAVPVYVAALPVALELQQLDLVVKWSLKAAQLDPSNAMLLMQTAEQLLKRNDLEGAIQLFERASKTAALDRASPLYVVLMRDLATLYSASEVDRSEDAAAAFEVVFDALENPEKYKLEPQALQKLQNDPAANFERMGQVFLKAKKTDRALAAFQKAAESKKGLAAGTLSFFLAQAQLQAGHADEALDEIQKYIDSERQLHGRAAYQLLADILEKLGKSQELLQRLQDAAAKDARNTTLQFFLAEQLASAGRLDEAESLFKSTLESAAEPEGYLGLAGVYRRQRRPAELIAALGKSYSESGELKGMTSEFKAIIGDEKLLESLLDTAIEQSEQQPARLDFASSYVLANLAAEGKRTARAERLYRFALSLRGERAALILQELGGHFTEVHKYADAVRVFSEAVDDVRLADARPTFLYFLSQARELAGDTKGALEAIATAQQNVGENVLLMSQEAWIYYHSQQYPEAIERYKKLLADFPQARSEILRRAQSVLSNIYVLQGEAQKGIEILEAIYEQNPREVGINNDLGYLYADQGLKLEQAETMIKIALAAEPEKAEYLDSMGWVLFKLGRFDEALPFLEKAVKVSTGNGDETLYDHLGDVYDRLERPDEALAAWKKSLELATSAAFPDRKLIARVEEKLKRCEEKLKNRKSDTGKLKPAKAGNP